MALLLMAGQAWAEIVVVVSADSPIDSLKPQELADIFMGRRDDLPGGHLVEPIDLNEHAPAHEAFYTEYLGRSPAQVRAHWSKLVFTGRGRPPRSASDSAEVAEIVARNPRAIGYLERDRVDDRLRVVPIEPR